RGGTLINVSQPRFERVLTLSIAKRLPPDKHQEYHFEGDFRDTGDRRPTIVRVPLIDRRPTTDEEQTVTIDEGQTISDDLEEEDDTLPVRTIELVVEVMGRVSNIVMVEEDGTVMDS